MKKLTGIFLSFFMILSLAACGGSESSELSSEASTQETSSESEVPSSESEAQAGNMISIKFAAQNDLTSAFVSAVQGFNESQSAISVEWVDMSNDTGAMRDQLVTSMMAGSSEYDVISMDVVWAGEFAASGYIDPIDQLMRDDGLQTSAFNPGSMKSGNYSGKQYVLPFYPDLGLLYYRKDIVSEEDAAKLESGAYTYDDLYAMAETYRGQGGTTDGYVFQSGLYEGLVCNLNEFTGNFTQISAGLETMKRFADSDVTPADILNYNEGNCANSFIQGSSVFSRNWPYQWGLIKEEGSITQEQAGVAPMPLGGTVGGWLLGINAIAITEKNRNSHNG